LQSKGYQAFQLVLYIIALLAEVWLFVAAISLMSQSVIGGITVVMLAWILAGGTCWRISFKWKQLKKSDERP
jgi:hypothetical protein